MPVFWHLTPKYKTKSETMFLEFSETPGNYRAFGQKHYFTQKVLLQYKK